MEYMNDGERVHKKEDFDKELKVYTNFWQNVQNIIAIKNRHAEFNLKLEKIFRPTANSSITKDTETVWLDSSCDEFNLILISYHY